MSRETHVRFWEGLGVRFPRATHCSTCLGDEPSSALNYPAEQRVRSSEKILCGFWRQGDADHDVCEGAQRQSNPVLPAEPLR